jgi:hypothetical protein
MKEQRLPQMRTAFDVCNLFRLNSLETHIDMFLW